MLNKKPDLGTVIADYRKQNDMSQIDVANALEKYDIHIKNAAVSAWEKGNSTPDANQLLALCRLFNITDIYDAFIGPNPSNPLSGLNDAGRAKVLTYISDLKATGLYDAHPAADIVPIGRKMKVSLIATSAGTGDYLDDENFEEVEIFDKVPDCADFGVYLNGDSMEPRFKNNELVWFEKSDTLESGNLGLFYLDGKTYFKKYHTGPNGTFLVSLNAKYSPIPVDEFSTLKIFAKLAID